MQVGGMDRMVVSVRIAASFPSGCRPQPDAFVLTTAFVDAIHYNLANDHARFAQRRQSGKTPSPDAQYDRRPH
jgi:hypothetical protein